MSPLHLFRRNWGIGRKIWRSGSERLETEGSGREASKFQEILLDRIIENKRRWGDQKI
jgi:hypothetical protein